MAIYRKILSTTNLDDVRPTGWDDRKFCLAFASSLPDVLEECGNLGRGPSIHWPAVTLTCRPSKEGAASEENDGLERSVRDPAVQVSNQLYSEQICKDFKKKCTCEKGTFCLSSPAPLLISHSHHPMSQFLSGKSGWQVKWSKSSWKTPRNYGTLIKESKGNVFQTTWKPTSPFGHAIIFFEMC